MWGAAPERESVRARPTLLAIRAVCPDTEAYQVSATVELLIRGQVYSEITLRRARIYTQISRTQKTSIPGRAIHAIPFWDELRTWDPGD